MKQTLNVIRFELMRNLKKPSFWLVSIALPIILSVYIGICAMTGYNAEESLANIANIDDKSIAYFDASGYIQNETYAVSDGATKELTKLESKEQGIDAVKSGKYDIFFYVPDNFYPNQETGEQKAIEIYSRPETASIFEDYSHYIQSIMSTTALQNIDPSDLIVVQGALTFDSTIFDHEDNSIVDQSEILSHMAGPALALIFFYILICVLGNRLVVAMTEEKENRITELLLTSIKPIYLIIGKVISLMILGFLQLFILVVPALLLYGAAKNMNIIPLDISLQLSFGSILQNFVLLISAYYLFTAFCVFIGVISPSAKDANSYASIIVILTILPLIFMNVFIGDSNVALANFFTFFPPSAPLAVMFRSIFNTISPLQTWLAVAEILIIGTLVIIGATKIYCKNAVNYTPKVNFKKLLTAPRKSWKK